MANIDDILRRLIRPEVQALKSYHVPDARGLIKLDAMESPYPWPESLKPAWLERLRALDVNRYPDPSARQLKARLREALAVPAAADILLGNGSDELIQMIVMALARPDAVVLAPVPTFVMYEQIAIACGVRFVGVPLAADFGLDRAAMLAAVAAHRPAVIFLSYPNNPTGNLFDARAMEALLEASPGLVVVDEAYHAFARASFMDRLARYPNLLVMRTLSKQGLAGLRLGILIGAPAALGEFDKVRLPYNINSLTQASAEFALAQDETFAGQCREITGERERLYEALRQVPGVEAWPSRTNFLLFRVSGGRAAEVHAALRDDGILIKNLDGAGGVLRGCLRVTVGTPDENRAFLAALQKACGGRAVG
ncbi:MAG: histidinol-phosphate transaminase [Sulfurifustis sp.]